MSTSINNLKRVIIERISDDITTVQDVADYEKTLFRGYPAVTVACSDNENEYWSTAENQRAFSFVIRVYVNLERKPTLDLVSDNAKERAERVMGNVVSEMIDSFDEYYRFGDNADYCKAAPSAWGYVNLSGGWARTAEIKLEVVKHYTVS